ncbi:hypothetical protein EOD00_16160 [Mesorhizobium sp. M7A.T.Ca.TU.009.01.3.1]|nr:hypothetical protein EOD00_16160 [Mesorhizobium sp. M7A.T.Ca.TU.009.01.3.1]
MGEADRRRGRPPVGTPAERLERQRKLGRERQDRRKEREATGSIVLQLPIDHVVVSLMLEVGAVDEASSRNRKRLCKAALRILNNALVTAVASGRKFSIEQEEQHARENTEGGRHGLHQHSEDTAEASRDRRGGASVARVGRRA